MAIFVGLIYGANDMAELRTFPELTGKKIYKLETAQKGYFAVCYDGEGLLFWEGAKWNPFKPRLPLREMVTITGLKVFSPTNIWVFYESIPRDYYTQCLHFDGKRWQKIHLPQSNTLDHFSFLDSTRFMAAGFWGSLIYFDGNKAKNLPHIPFAYTRAIHALSENSYIIALVLEENDVDVHYYYVNDGKYTFIYSGGRYPQDIRLIFDRPDKGYIISGKKCLWYSEQKSSLLDSLIVESNYTFFKNSLYYYGDKWIRRYNFDKEKLLFSAPEIKKVHPLILGDFLLLTNSGRILYYGPKKLGNPYFTDKPAFRLHWWNMGNSGDFGTALYRNNKEGIHIYIASYSRPNTFMQVSKDKKDFILNDIIKKSNLFYYKNPGAKTLHRFWDAGVFFNDLDNDGDVDAILTTLRGTNRLFENTGDDYFVDVTSFTDFQEKDRTGNILWTDLNRDGYMDFIVGASSGPLRLYLNKGYMRFENKTGAAFLPDSIKGYTPRLADVDNDGDRDLFLFRASGNIYYFENQTEPHPGAKIVFMNKSDLSPQLTKRPYVYTQTMAFGDYDNDGDLDLFLANRVTPLALFENTGGGRFIDVSRQKGIEKSCLAYTANWGDFNLDGFQDIFVGTVGKNYILWNHNARYFEMDSMCIQENFKGLTVSSVVGDVDNDGDPDIVVSESEFGHSAIYINGLNRHNSICIRFPYTNCIGTKVWLYKETAKQESSRLAGFRDIELTTGYMGSGLPEVCFGVEKDTEYRATIRLPNGKEIVKNHLKAGNIYTMARTWELGKWESMKGRLFSLLLNGRKRIKTIQYFMLFLFWLILNWVALRRYNWPKFYFLFFNLSVFSVFFLLTTLWRGQNTSLELFIPLTLTILIGLGIFYLINRYSHLYYGDFYYFKLFDLLRQYNHSNNGIKYIDHLIFLCNNYNPSQNLQWTEKVREELTYFNAYSIPFLKRINEMYSRLYHKNHLQKSMKSIELLSKKILFRKKLGGDGIEQRLKGELTNLKKIILRIRTQIEKLYSAPLLDTVTAAVRKFPFFNTITIKNELEDTNPAVLIRRDELIQALSNVMQNALEAMQDKNEKILEITLKKNTDMALQIAIRDFGTGLHAETDVLFKEGYSTKNSTGLGLYHTKKILENFGGAVHLKKPKEGAGAIVELTLRQSYADNHIDD